MRFSDKKSSCLSETSRQTKPLIIIIVCLSSQSSNQSCLSTAWFKAETAHVLLTLSLQLYFNLNFDFFFSKKRGDKGNGSLERMTITAVFDPSTNDKINA